ncbi:hypothetical protein F0219_22425 [Salmonella enterica]|nr:hypothetical protein [Salmonella enterica]EDQ4281378.1 hypothetical protein [Salmonella enterica subsp. enterica serovar Bredeney]EEK7334733.1 hypothetical protein [Salmonella enterica subsp. enterica serovar Newport]EHL9388752.1 hypothetical protein [Salmonella enterica subsp. enterica serovar Oranienburg]ELY4843844.1 hypothetical protein [Cronobacter sakazakii]
MIGNNNDDYDDYAGDDETKTVPLSCEDDYEKDFEEKSVLRKMIEYKSDSLFGVLYEVSSILGFSLIALIGFVLLSPIYLFCFIGAFILTLKEKV